MNKPLARSGSFSQLREKAEQLALGKKIDPGTSNEDMLRQLHELQVSQIELEIQNVALVEMQRLKDEFESGLTHYAELYERAPVAYFSIERDGRISRVNQAAAALLNSDMPALLGKRFEQFVAPEDQGRLRAFIDTVFHSGARQVMEAKLFDGVGGIEQIRIEANVDPDPVASICRMIVTDLGDAARESALRRAFVVLDNIMEGVLITDGQRIVSVNPAFTIITGYQAEEVIGRDPAFLNCDDQPSVFFSEIWSHLRHSGSWQGEVLSRRKNGEPFIEWLSVTQLRDPDGGRGHYVGVFSDITGRKQAELALRQLHSELDQRVVARTAELTQANQALLLEIAERERAEVALRDAEQFFHAALDSLPDRVLVLDDCGVIVHANKSCLEFSGHTGRGTVYLDACETDPRWQRGAGAELAAGIRRVIAGALESFALEYEFRADGARQWGHATVSRFLGDGPLRVVVSHADITERKVMEKALRQSHAQLRQLAIHLETAKEDERKRISRDIHDELGQNLLALRIDISMLDARTANTHPRLHKRVGEVLKNVDVTIKSVRGIMNALRPPVLDLGLQAAVEWQIADFKKRSGIDCQLWLREPLVLAGLGAEIQTVLFRIVQEALSNVIRHARAKRVDIEFCSDQFQLGLTISDDGIGITPQQRRKVQCFGLIGIAERISALGGQFTLEQYNKGQGCCLTMRVPLLASKAVPWLLR